MWIFFSPVFSSFFLLFFSHFVFSSFSSFPPFFFTPFSLSFSPSISLKSSFFYVFLSMFFRADDFSYESREKCFEADKKSHNWKNFSRCISDRSNFHSVSWKCAPITESKVEARRLVCNVEETSTTTSPNTTLPSNSFVNWPTKIFVSIRSRIGFVPIVAKTQTLLSSRPGEFEYVLLFEGYADRVVWNGFPGGCGQWWSFSRFGVRVFVGGASHLPCHHPLAR